MRISDWSSDVCSSDLEPTTLDPAAARNRIVLATKGLEIATFFDLIGVDGLSGSGRLTGSLPFVFAGNAIIVEDSQFDALGPGRLYIRIPAPRQALAGGSETVEAAVKALEDFNNEELTFPLAKRSGERLVGKEVVSTCICMRWQLH